MKRVSGHLIVAILAVTTIQAQQSPASATFNISIGGTRVGQEIVTVAPTADGWLISSTGRRNAPQPFSIDRFELDYSADWQPRSLVFEATTQTQLISVNTRFTADSAVNDILQSGQKTLLTHKVSPRTVVLPNDFFAGYEALAPRLGKMSVGTTFPVYVAPQTEITATVVSVTEKRMQTLTTSVDLRQFSLSFKNAGGTIAAEVSIDSKDRLARVAIPAAALVVIRDDLSSVMTRDESYRNPGDTNVFIPASGFTLAATTTAPAAGGEARRPAVILISGAGTADRDENLFGVPMFGQLAGQLANAGFFVVRYDKRGIGQSGGRTENASLADYASDVTDVVAWLRKLKNVDSDRIALVGHSEGGAVALLAAAKAGGKVRAVALLSSPGETGRAITLARQTRALDRLTDTPEMRQAKVQAQIKILDAVTSGNGWETIPPQIRRQADTPWFKSWIEFDPATAFKKVDQPVLIVHGSVDKEIAPANADRLETLSNARKNKEARLTKKVLLPGVNHLLIPAVTGEEDEYLSLTSKTISPGVAAAIAEWLNGVAFMKKQVP
jgi:pimeloyl-ACP methyl ester carboxylesterase